MIASTLSSWALLIWQELEARKLPAAAIFAQAGMDPAELKNPLARYPWSQLQTLWELTHQASDDDIGIAIGQRWSPTSFHALGFAWLASASLGDALYRFSRYGSFLNDGLDYQLSAEGLQYRFSIRQRQNKQLLHSAIAIDAGVAALIKMLRMLLGPQFCADSINVPHPPNQAGLLLEQLCACPIHYQGDSIDFLFAREDIEQALATGNAELTQAHETILQQHLAKREQQDLVNRTELAIIQQLPSGNIKESNIAAVLNMSSRTLQRRLAEKNCSFSQLLQKIRQQRSLEYVDNRQLALSEIAYLLGFSEQANFTRAFKRWYGCTPSEYRKQNRNASPTCYMDQFPDYFQLDS